MRIQLASPDISEQDIEAVVDVLRTPTLSLGPKLPEFEQRMAQYVGTRHAVAVNSGTSALHCIIRGLGIADDDEVITTPFSFVASSNAMLFERAKPVFVDIDPVSLNINARAIEAAISPRTKAIMPVHVFGRTADMEPILEIARRHKLRVIEDSCEALGTSWRGQMAGSIGDCGAFAFYPNKQMTTGEGGMVVTDDDDLAAMARSLRNQGRGDAGTWLAHERLGYNYRLSDINCALGITQLSRMDSFVQKRAEVAARYGQLLGGVSEIIPPPPYTEGTMSWFVYVIRLADRFGLDQREAVLHGLRQQGIGCNNYFTPIHLQPFYRQQFGYRPGDFPVTEFIAERTIALPFYNNLSPADQQTVVDVLKEIIAGL